MMIRFSFKTTLVTSITLCTYFVLFFPTVCSCANPAIRAKFQECYQEGGINCLNKDLEETIDSNLTRNNPNISDDKKNRANKFDNSGSMHYSSSQSEYDPFRKNIIKDEHLSKTNKLSPLITEILEINYAKAYDIAGMIKDKNNTILSKRGVLRIDARTNTILVQDTKESIEGIKKLVKRLDIPVKQVLIEARIVNVTKDCAEDIGVRFGISKPLYFGGSLESVNTISNDANNIFPARKLNVDLGAIPLDASPGTLGLTLAKLGQGVILDLELSALESEGRAEIIASPRLMATNQHTAIIESGEDIPYQEATLSGATAVAFKKAVLSLKVKPEITKDDKLLMDLQINQDLDSGRRVQGVPIILTKSISTNVLVGNGQTLVLGGIYKKNRHNAVMRVPILGRIPFLGILFRRTQMRIKNEELLIFITPRIASGWKLKRAQ